MRDRIREALTDEQVAIIESGALQGEARTAFVIAFAEAAGCSVQRVENILAHLERGDRVTPAAELWQKHPGQPNRATRRRRRKRHR